MDLADALAYLDEHVNLERRRPARIDVAVARAHAARSCDVLGDPQHAAPGHPRHRHERQGLDRADDHPAADGPRPHGRHLHQPAPRADQRAHRAQRRADQRRRASPSRSPAVADLEVLAGVRADATSRSLTAAAFRWFADVAVDVAVVEVGLLGRWDATNVVDGQVAVVTNVGLDHTEFAGPTRRRHRRARRRASSSRAATLVLGETDPELVAVFRAERRRETCSCAASTSTCDDNQLAVGGRLLDLRTPDDDLHRRVPAAARRAPGRQRRGCA